MLRQGRWLVLLAGLAIGSNACGADEPATQSDPFAPSIDWPTGLPARALAVVDAPAATVALAFRFEDRVGLLDAFDGDLQPAAAAVGVSPMAIAALDADGDGTAEVATANTGDGTLSLLRQVPGGLAPLATARSGLRPKHVASADLDGDGRAEAVVTAGLLDEPGAGIEVWRFAAGALERVGSRWIVEDAFAAATGDVDGDGDLDVIAVLPSAGAIAWAENDGRGALREAGRVAVCDAPRAAALAGDTVVVACPDGLAQVRGDEVAWRAVDGNLYDVVAGDFDRDGYTDVAAVDRTHGAVLVFLGRPDGGLGPPLPHPVGADPVALVAADLGADGDLDLVVSAFGSRTVDVLDNRAAQTERTAP